MIRASTEEQERQPPTPLGKLQKERYGFDAAKKK